MRKLFLKYKNKLELPIPGTEEDEFVKASFRVEFNRFVFPITVVVATFQDYSTMYFDYNKFGIQKSWILLRTCYFPLTCISYWMWKQYFIKLKYFYMFPVVVSLGYISMYMAVLLSMSSLTDSIYHSGIFELYIAMAIFPLLIRTYFIMFAGLTVFLYTLVYFFSQEAFLNQYPLIISNNLPTYIFTILLFFVTWKVRIDKARLEYRMKNILEDQSTTIRIQSDDLARAKIFEAVNEAMQMVAHDVRKPFHMIKSGLKMLKEELKSESGQNLFTVLSKNIDSSLFKVNGTFKDIMHVGQKPEAMDFQKFNIAEIIYEIAEDIKKIYEDKQFTLRFLTAHREVFAFIAENKFKRAIFNVVDNAVQAVSANGKIEIKLEEYQQVVQITIHNDGPPIKEEIIAKIFDPMFTSGKKNGTGLGLHIAKLFISEHMGNISCTSNPDEGTTFHVKIPVNLGMI